MTSNKPTFEFFGKTRSQNITASDEKSLDLTQSKKYRKKELAVLTTNATAVLRASHGDLEQTPTAKARLEAGTGRTGFRQALSPKAALLKPCLKSTYANPNALPKLSQLKSISQLSHNQHGPASIALKRRPSNHLTMTLTDLHRDPVNHNERRLGENRSADLKKPDLIASMDASSHKISKLSKSISVEENLHFSVSLKPEMKVLPPTLHEVMVRSSHPSNSYPQLDLSVLDVKAMMEKNYEEKKALLSISKVKPNDKDYAQREELLGRLNKISKPRATLERRDVLTLSNWYRLMFSDVKKYFPPEANFGTYCQTQVRLLDFSFSSLSSMLRAQCKDNSDTLDLFYNDIIILMNQLLSSLG